MGFLNLNYWSVCSLRQLLSPFKQAVNLSWQVLTFWKLLTNSRASNIVMDLLSQTVSCHPKTFFPESRWDRYVTDTSIAVGGCQGERPCYGGLLGQGFTNARYTWITRGLCKNADLDSVGLRFCTLATLRWHWSCWPMLAPLSKVLARRMFWRDRLLAWLCLLVNYVPPMEIPWGVSWDNYILC